MTKTNILKKIPMKSSNEYDIMSDIRYIRKSCSLVTDALKKGCDVLQMPNGDIVITEIRTVSFQYTWDDEKIKFVKVKSGSRLRRLRSQKIAAESQTQYSAGASKTAATATAAPAAGRKRQKVLEEALAD